MRGGGRRERRGDGGMVPTSTSARNCFGGVHHNEGGGWEKIRG